MEVPVSVTVCKRDRRMDGLQMHSIDPDPLAVASGGLANTSADTSRHANANGQFVNASAECGTYNRLLL